jgi:predicted AAA+ superfamily ATPase
MLDRLKNSQINQLLDMFPAVVLVGPRQSGKTTLAKALTTRYYDLELDSERLRLDLQWSQLCSEDGLVVLDEAQSYPEIFPRLRAAIDDRREAKAVLKEGSCGASVPHREVSLWIQESSLSGTLQESDASTDALYVGEPF